jgi:hypothetical protein
MADILKMKAIISIDRELFLRARILKRYGVVMTSWHI